MDAENSKNKRFHMQYLVITMLLFYAKQHVSDFVILCTV